MPAERQGSTNHPPYSPFAPWKQDPLVVLLCCPASSPHPILFQRKLYAMQINHPTAHEQQFLPTPLPCQGCRGLCNLFTRTLTRSFSSCNTAESAGTGSSERSRGERASGAAQMPSQGSRLLAGYSGARGERTSFGEGRSAWPQRRCLRPGDPAPGTGNGSLPAASLQAPWLPATPTLQAPREGREGKNTCLSATWHGFPRKSLAL